MSLKDKMLEMGKDTGGNAKEKKLNLVKKELRKSSVYEERSESNITNQKPGTFKLKDYSQLPNNLSWIDEQTYNNINNRMIKGEKAEDPGKILSGNMKNYKNLPPVDDAAEKSADGFKKTIGKTIEVEGVPQDTSISKTVPDVHKKESKLLGKVYKCTPRKSDLTVKIPEAKDAERAVMYFIGGPGDGSVKIKSSAVGSIASWSKPGGNILQIIRGIDKWHKV